jgi:hypothetical protein
MFGNKSRFGFDVDKFLEIATKGDVLEEMAIKLICAKVKDILLLEENVKVVPSPVTVVGDVHG